MGKVEGSIQVGFQAARLDLARTLSSSGNARGDAAARACRILAKALGVERVSVWVFDETREKLRCEHLYILSKDEVSAGPELETRQFPTYCRALDEHMAIAVNDIGSHLLTAELVDIYLRPLGITSMLDAAIHRSGQVFGVVCHEHVGPARAWTQAEVDFASAVAEMVATTYEQAERLSLEARLRTQAAQMAGLEQLQQLRSLTRAVAHDFNNIMTGVVKEVVALKKQGHTESAAAITRCVEVGVSLLGELANFGRPSSAGKADVAEVLETLRLPLQMLVRDQAELTLEFVNGTGNDETALVPLRPVEVEQLLLNLCVNARDAVEIDGRIVVRVGVQDDEVLIEVSDNGCGMDEETRAHALEPFFTTKETGTGLGLTIVSEILKKAGGVLEIESRLQAGSHFRIRLPRVAA